MERIRVFLTNRIARIECDSEEAFSILRRYWSFRPKGYFYSPKYKLYLRALAMANANGEEIVKANLPGWDGYITMFKRGIVPAGLFRSTRQELKQKYGFVFEVVYSLPNQNIVVDNLKERPTEEKYDYQDDCVEAMSKALKRGGGIVLAATRSGKTRICARFFKRLHCKCLFVVDQLDLLYQAKEDIELWTKEKVGVVGDSVYEPGRITVATVQTIKAHLNDLTFLDWFKSVQVVVVDELHEQLARKNFDVMHTINPLARYGLTATLKLSKKEIRLKAHSFAGPVIFRFSIQEGIERDVLTKGRCIQLLFPSQSDSNSDYLLDYASQVTGNKDKLNTVTALVSSLVLMDRYVLVLTEHVKHMLAISESAASIPIPHGVAHGEIDKSARKNDRNLFESGHIRLLISTAVYRKGVTLKRLDVVIDTAEKPDQNAAVQKFGRGLGKHKDKTDLLYIDIGTYGDFRFSKAARSRSKALKAIGVEVISRRVRTVNDALKAVREFIAEPEQLSLLGS